MNNSFTQQRSQWLERADTQSITLSQIKADIKDQVRSDGTDPQLVEQYTRLFSSEDSMPPVVLIADEEHYRILDGFHRVSAATRAGLQTIKAKILKGLSTQQQEEYRLTCNLQHGKSASTKDRSTACKKLIENHFEDFVEGYKFDTQGFADYYGFGKTAVAEHSKWRRIRLENTRDLEVLRLKSLGLAAQQIADAVGVTRQKVGAILKEARALESTLEHFRTHVEEARSCCDTILNYEKKLIETTELPDHNGPSTDLYTQGLAIGFDWNWEDGECVATVTQEMARRWGFPNPEEHPEEEDPKITNSRYGRYMQATDRLPEYDKVNEIFNEASVFHHDRMTWETPSTTRPNCRLGHVSAYLNDSEYKELYDFWVFKAFGSMEAIESTPAGMSNPTYAKALRKLWAITEAA